MSKRIGANESFVAGLAVASLMLIALAGPAQAGTEDEIKALFEKFVTAPSNAFGTVIT
jgi:hypothetical protein